MSLGAGSVLSQWWCRSCLMYFEVIAHATVAHWLWHCAAELEVDGAIPCQVGPCGIGRNARALVYLDVGAR